jgi:hypothetical protein
MQVLQALYPIQRSKHPVLHFGYEVSFKVLNKGAIEILGLYGISYTF